MIIHTIIISRMIHNCFDLKNEWEKIENDFIVAIESFFFLLHRIYFWFCSISIDTHTRSSYKDLTHTQEQIINKGLEIQSHY